MCQSNRFLESILFQDGEFPLLSFHLERFLQTWSLFFPTLPVPDLWKELNSLPALHGLYKVRAEYDSQGIRLQCLPYKRKKIRTFSFVEDDTIQYDYKFADREKIEKHLQQSVKIDHEIIFVKNNLVTDSSIANIVIQKNGHFLTPEKPLLQGVRRAQSLATGRILLAKITVQDLLDCEKIFFINALNSLDDDFSALPKQFLP